MHNPYSDNNPVLHDQFSHRFDKKVIGYRTDLVEMWSDY